MPEVQRLLLSLDSLLKADQFLVQHRLDYLFLSIQSCLGRVDRVERRDFCYSRQQSRFGQTQLCGGLAKIGREAASTPKARCP